MRATFLILMLSATSSACYQYFPVQDTSPLPQTGDEVRVQLSPPQSLDLGTMTLHDVSALEGDVYRSQGDTLALFSRQLRTTYGTKHHTNGAVFYFSRDQFRRLEERRFVPIKSAIAVGVVAAGLLASYYFAMRGAGGSEDPGPPGGTDMHIVGSIPLRILIGR